MPDLKDICTGIFIVAMLFFVVPVRIEYPGRTKSSFNNYVKKFNKSYESDKSQYESRYNNFKTSLLKIEELNTESEGRTKFGLTEYSDMSEEEFLNNQLDLRPKNKKIHRKHKKHHESRERVQGMRYERAAIPSIDVPPSIDWRDRDVVTPIRNQGLCGACWAHSTVAAVESRLAILTGSLLELSVEEMIDCARFGNFGCNGGDICSLLVWLQRLNIPILKQEQYTSNQDKICTLDTTNITNREVITIKEYLCEDYSKQENTILSLLANHGPVAVAVNALPWQHYLGGVIQFHCSGKPEDLNHAVQIVGYDLTADIPYYIVRNSWGPTFGDGGYLKLAIGGNICGVANEVASVDLNY